MVISVMGSGALDPILAPWSRPRPAGAAGARSLADNGPPVVQARAGRPSPELPPAPPGRREQARRSARIAGSRAGRSPLSRGEGS
ncbi:MAG TPA: hypothetical protein VE152_13705 [Acidimicrobiales bacterium]|nr:hypothetical protein [Acidimicrobiales bacterium]